MKHIYIALLEEGVAYWRPVKAKHQRDDVYLIVDFNQDEVWEFQTGESVRCRMKTFSSGQTGLIAFQRASGN